MKKILVIGAGQYQVPLIKTVRRLGMKALVLGIAGNYPGIPYADTFYPVNFKDVDKVIEIARSEKIDAVLTAALDPSVTTIAAVAKACGLTALSTESASIVTNKRKMKECFCKAGVRTADHIVISLENAEQQIREALASERFHYPVILKAVDNCGSRGVIKIESEASLSYAIELVRSNTRLDYCLLEDFITGNEMGVEAYVQNGEVTILLPNGKYIFYGDTQVPLGHYAPCDLSPEFLEDIHLQVTKAALACGLDNCPINVDVIERDQKAYIVEIAGRSGGVCLPELVSICHGYNYYEKMIAGALGEHIDLSTVSSRAGAAMLLTSPTTGILKSQSYQGPMEDYIYEISYDFKPGDAVHEFRNGSHRIGHVVVSGDTLSEADARLKETMKNFRIEVEETR